MTLLIAADVTLALAPHAWVVADGAALWALHMGATQGTMTAIVADTAPDQLHGTALGMFNLITGVAVRAASVIAGGMWTFLAWRGRSTPPQFLQPLHSPVFLLSLTT